MDVAFLKRDLIVSNNNKIDVAADFIPHHD
jgi:hypothetical protein